MQWRGAAFAQKKRALKRAAKEGKLVLSKDAAAAAAPRASRPQFSHDDLSFVQEEIADRSKFLQQLEHLGRGAFRVLLRLSPNEGEIIVRIAFVTLSLGCAFLAFVPCSFILCSACCGFHIALHLFHIVQHSLHHRSPSLSRYIVLFLSFSLLILGAYSLCNHSLILTVRVAAGLTLCSMLCPCAN